MTDEHRGRLLPVHIIQRIRRLHGEGFTVSRIARLSHVHRETVYKYIRMNPDEYAEALRAASMALCV